jgi:hypothetical protein
VIMSSGNIYRMNEAEWKTVRQHELLPSLTCCHRKKPPFAKHIAW